MRALNQRVRREVIYDTLRRSPRRQTYVAQQQMLRPYGNASRGDEKKCQRGIERKRINKTLRESGSDESDDEEELVQARARDE
jgi:hypothetical protein